MQKAAIIGTFTKNYVQIDFDEMSFLDVIKICDAALKKWNLEGYIIIKSSKQHYHAVFNKYFKKWEDVAKIMSWIAIISENIKVKDYVLLQIIRKESTLRLTEKANKPKPRIVYRCGKHDKGILWYETIKKYVTKIH